jgi:hypothetical protein
MGVFFQIVLSGAVPGRMFNNYSVRREKHEIV